VIRNVIARAAWLALCALLSGCVAGPEYKKPALDMPAAWKVDSPWRVASPGDAAAKGPWWQAFGDPELNALEERASESNATLAIANARLAQARATLAATSASVFPQVGTSNRLSRQQISANRPLTNYNSPNYSTIQNELALAMSVSYEVDLADRVAQSINGARASLEQSAADLENTRLLISADLATNYFNLREIDIETDVLRRAIGLQQRSLELMGARHELGAATGLDLAQQQALLDSTLVQLDLLARQRAQFEHAIATLVGVPAAQFSLAVAQRDVKVPPVPLGVPSDVLERRPDIAAAERAMAAANAQIGVASAAYYPSITLGASGGFDSRALPMLFDAPSLIWAFGVTLAQTLFDGGRIQANVDFASAGYAATVANYRRVTLVAMQEVEDGISGLAALDHATQQARTAVATWQRVFDMTTARYEGGASTYLEVIIAQQALLNSERQAAQLVGQQLVTSVFLIKALGGGWQGASLASTQKAALVQ
jgi:NodT family efflux transporter outer membrane factor (OMF) lipoprotein